MTSHQKFFWISIILFLCACQNNHGKETDVNNVTPQSKSRQVSVSPTIVVDDAEDTLSIPAKMAENAVIIYQPDNLIEGQLMDEMNFNKWYALLHRGKKYFLKQTVLNFKHPLDGNTDLWSAASMESDSCVFLISGFDGKEDTVSFAGLSNVVISPGQSMSFRFNRRESRLTATGNKNKNGLISSYKLFYEVEESQKWKKQLLVAVPHLDDTMISVIWAGDIDFDGEIDFILDISRKYSLKRVGIFLSTRATGLDESVRFSGEFYGIND